MRKIILGLLFTICTTIGFGMSTLSTIPLSLSTSGSVTVYDNTPAQLYLISGNDSLTGDLSIIFSGTPYTGSQFTLWFNNTNINLGAHKFYILSQDYGGIIGGSVNVFVTCTYNGSAWTVSNINKSILAYLSNYVTTSSLTTTLVGYEDTASLTSRLALYGLLSSATFTNVFGPTKSSSDSTTALATTQFAHQILTTYAKLASPALTGVPIAPTPTVGDNSTKIATTNFVSNALSTYIPAYLIGSGTLNPATLDVGAGAGASVTVTGNATGFKVILVTGTGCTASSNILTVPFGSVYPNTPLAFIQGRNPSAKSTAFNLVTPSESTTGISFTSGATQLADATTYIFNVMVIGQ